MQVIHFIPLQACLVGIVVPDPEVMPSWAQKRGIDGCYDDLCKNMVSPMQKLNIVNEIVPVCKNFSPWVILIVTEFSLLFWRN